MILVIFAGFSYAFAYEPIPITISNKMDKIIFDGKWTFEYEWKSSSLNTYTYNDTTQIVLRSAHQDNFVYIFLDPITDAKPEKTKDYAVICFDTQNDKTLGLNQDNYCFMSVLGNNTYATYHSDDNATKSTQFTKIPNPDDVIAIGDVSDDNDRYIAIPHPSYEFKIPTSLIGRESVYGFYFVVYDDDTKKYYTYPTEIDTNEVISSPSEWGEIYSPDKSLPEFYLPFLITIPAFAFIIILNKTKRFL